MGRARDELFGWIETRTQFFDAVVVDALRDGIRQIVILGAGYDGRALRYRTPGVTFLEVDHPATQGDKRARLDAVHASTEGITFVPADFTEPGLADALAAAGHDAGAPTQYVCEGVLRYLPEAWFRELLRVAAVRAAPGSRLAVSVSTRDSEPSETEQAREESLAAAGESVFTVPPRAVAFDWIAAAGWTVETVVDPLAERGEHRRGRLLVAATRGADHPARAPDGTIP